MANDLDQSVSNAIAGGVSAPIDLIAWALRKAGVPGVEKPVLGSDWMREKGLTRPVQPGPGQVVGETIGNLLDPLSALGSASKAALVGIGSLDPLMVRASDLLRKGVSREAIWNQLGVEHVPHHSSAVPLDPDVLVAGVREISDAGLKPNPFMLMSYDDKMRHIVSKLPAIDQASAALRAKTTPVFYPGRYRVEDLISHPELFNSGGDVGKIRVLIDDKANYRGMYNPIGRGISLGTKSFLTAPSEGAVSTLLHELTHDTQRRFGMPTGAMVSNFSYAPNIKDKLRVELEGLAKGPNDIDAAHAASVLKTFDAPYKTYLNVLGEQQARAVQQRLLLSDGERASIVPSASYSDLYGGFPPEFVRSLVNKLRTPSP